MANRTTRLPDRTDSMAEGSDEPHDQPAKKTSTIPAVRYSIPVDSPMSETGVITRISRFAAEGKDRTDGQDASRTRDETRPESAPLIPGKAAADKTRVLIVEDTVELAEVIQATLEGMGLDVVYATHGKIGLEKMKQINPALVVMDIGLPDITGWKMLDSIKEHYTTSTAKMPAIIVITAYGDPANRLIGKLQGIHSYLIKPFTPDEVENLVRMALNGETPPDQNLRDAEQK
jgi:CheY-like chemotaxis protein